MRTVFTDPDHRRSPKTAFHCWVCYKDIKNGESVRYFFARQDCYHVAIHPEDIHMADGQVDKLEIGESCARKIGLEFTVKE